MESNDPGTPPPPPSGKQTYKQGVNTYLKFLDRLLGREMESRTSAEFGDPARIGWQQALQGAFGPTQYAQQLEALQQINPEWYNLQRQTGQKIGDELALGTQLSPEFSNQLEQNIRGGQAARGNLYGNAPITEEAFGKGAAGLQLQQQRIGNALGFQQSSTPGQQLTLIPPVSADRSMAYVNPNAGFQGQQFGLQNYQNQLGAYGLANQQGGGSNPWMSAISTGASVIGAIAPLLMFSDKRLKENIRATGEKTSSGIPIKTWNYKGDDTTYSGVIAQDAQRKQPEAVWTNEASGIKAVDYAQIVGA